MTAMRLEARILTAAGAALLAGMILLPSAFAAQAPKGQYPTEAEARTSCPSDGVVWVNLRSGVYHVSASRSYGKTQRGVYMCEREAETGGYRATKPRRPKAA